MIEKAHASSLPLADVLDRVLDKGIVIDACCQVSIAGTQLVTVCSQVVVASIDTYLKYVEDGVAVTSPSPGQGVLRPRASRQFPPVVDLPAFLPD
jgi:hypothetical protein